MARGNSVTTPAVVMLAIRLAPNSVKFTAGVVTEFATLACGSSPNLIALGPDGNMWFTEDTGPGLGRIKPDGTFVEFPLDSTHGNPQTECIVIGPDGRMWFSQSILERIGAFTP